MKKDKYYVCFQCGSREVEHKCWVDVNSDKVLDAIDSYDIEDFWCRTCESHIKLITEDEYEKNQAAKLNDN